jgi:hypothetical protein
MFKLRKLIVAVRHNYITLWGRGLIPGMGRKLSLRHHVKTVSEFPEIRRPEPETQHTKFINTH